MSEVQRMNDSRSTLDAALVARLVGEVVQRIRDAGATPSASTTRAGGSPPPAAGSAPAPVATAAPAASPGGHVLADHVVTLAVLERVPAGTRRVVVGARAVLTPSAREHAADTGIEIVRQAGTPMTAAAAPRMFLVAHAACPADPSAKMAAIARAIPGTQRLPTTGLADVLAALAIHAGRDGARAVLLTGRPHLAVAAANRHASLRAVTGHDAIRVKGAVAECAANLLVLDPAALSSSALERLCSDLMLGADATPPTELATAPSTPCGCKGKHH
jgi:hypothetical protein